MYSFCVSAAGQINGGEFRASGQNVTKKMSADSDEDRPTRSRIDR